MKRSNSNEKQQISLYVQNLKMVMFKNTIIPTWNTAKQTIGLIFTEQTWSLS